MDLQCGLYVHHSVDDNLVPPEIFSDANLIKNLIKIHLNTPESH